jgi:hypothetical protein
MSLAKCPGSGLLLPKKLIEEKTSLKKSIDDLVEDCINQLSHLRENYFLQIHAKFNEQDSTRFDISQPVASLKLPPFTSNSLVYWISPQRGICELLWIVPAKQPGEKLKPEFNKKGVAYLQMKGAMEKSTS